MAAADDPLLVVMAAEHVILEEVAFTGAITNALLIAELGKLVAFGIVPKEPHTGFGYIKKGVQHQGGFLVDSLVEKALSKLS